MWQCNILRPFFTKMVQNNIVSVFIHEDSDLNSIKRGTNRPTLVVAASPRQVKNEIGLTCITLENSPILENEVNV